MAASEKVSPIWATPMKIPPRMLMNVIRRPAMASPRTEFRGTVHGPEKGTLVFQRLAAGFGFAFVDQPGRQVGVDRHLLAGHCVQGETRGNLGDTAGTLGDDDEVDDHQNGKDDNPDDEIAAHHQVAEGLDDIAGSCRSFMAVGQDQPCRGNVQPEPEHGGNQEYGREGREFERLLDKQPGHQDHDGKDDRHGQKRVQHHRRHRQDEQRQDDQNAGCKADITLAQGYRSAHEGPARPKSHRRVALPPPVFRVRVQVPPLCPPAAVSDIPNSGS